jgi:hypothetical protein
MKAHALYAQEGKNFEDIDPECGSVEFRTHLLVNFLFYYLSCCNIIQRGKARFFNYLATLSTKQEVDKSLGPRTRISIGI